jgi:hypothetical protein
MRRKIDVTCTKTRYLNHSEIISLVNISQSSSYVCTKQHTSVMCDGDG